MNKKLNVALIGLGYWGKNLLRNIVNSKLSNDVYICDEDIQRCIEAEATYRLKTSFSSAASVFSSEEINCVVISTPTTSHFELAKRALEAKKHVLVEKPMTTSSTQVSELISLAEKNDLILMVDHIYLYNPAVAKLKEYLSDRSKMGKVNYIDATRINLGIYQQDVNVLWDLACHDISIINFLLDEKPLNVRAIGRVHPHLGIEDLAYLFLNYPSGVLVQINASWASPVKIRNMIIGAEHQMIIYDDIEPTNKLTIYDYAQANTADEGKTKLTDYRLGNVVIPKFEQKEALQNVIEEFFDCILTHREPFANGTNALDVVRILEKAQESLILNGATIALA